MPQECHIKCHWKCRKGKNVSYGDFNDWKATGQNIDCSLKNINYL